MNILTTSLFFAFSLILGCFIPSSVLGGEKDSVARQPNEADSTSQADYPYVDPRDFAHAMQLLQNLSVIEGGGDIPPCRETANRPARFADAVDYVESMGSYSLVIWKDGKCQLETYFEPFDRDTRPESASMHKSVLGLLVAAAIADGHIAGPDVRIGDYIDEWSDDPRGDITVRQLLTMSSGLEPLSREGGKAAEAWRFVTGPADVRALVLEQTLAVPPGTVFHYSGVDSQLLMLVLESATGMDYVDYASARLWQPLEAADAYVWNYPGHDAMPRAHMSLLAPARDWLKVGLLLKDYGRYAGEQIIPRELIEEATSPSHSNPNYAWQLWLGEVHAEQRFYNEEKTGVSVPMAEPFAVDDMIFFDGFGGQRVYVSRSADLVIVRQGDLRLEWDDAVLPNLVLEAADE